MYRNFNDGHHLRERKRMNRMLRRRFEEIVVDGVENIKKIKDDLKFYILPHKSHADYIVFGLTVLDQNMKPPLFIAGDNLNVGKIGEYLNNIGAFFIKRNNKVGNYLEWMINSVKEKMQEGEDLALFPEAGRSYTGEVKRIKPLLFRAPIRVQGEDKDKSVYVIPSAVSYDIVRDDFELADLVREDRKENAEDVKKLLLSRGRIGNIYIDFGEPILVKDFLGNQGDNESESAKKLGRFAFEESKKLYRVTPTAMVAAASDGYDTISKIEMRDELEVVLATIHHNNANLKTIEDMSIDEIMDNGVGLFARRGIISDGGDTCKIVMKDVLKYYANTIDHVLKPK